METINKNSIIPAKVASEKSYKSVGVEVQKAVEELIPVINKSIEHACIAASYDTEIDLTKYNHITLIADTLIAKLKAAGYIAKLVDAEPRGYYLHIRWS